MTSLEWLLLFLFINTVQSGPVQFPENSNTGVVHEDVKDIGEQGEGRTFIAHAVKRKIKRKLKRRLLQCLLSAVGGRSNIDLNDPQARTLFLNFYDININTNDDEPYDDNNSGGGICGGQDSVSLLDTPTNIGEGINNLGTLVGQNPLQVINNGGTNDEKPVYERPERFLDRYFFRPIFKSWNYFF